MLTSDIKQRCKVIQRIALRMAGRIPKDDEISTIISLANKIHADVAAIEDDTDDFIRDKMYEMGRDV